MDVAAVFGDESYLVLGVGEVRFDFYVARAAGWFDFSDSVGNGLIVVSLVDGHGCSLFSVDGLLDGKKCVEWPEECSACFSACVFFFVVVVGVVIDVHVDCESEYCDG